MEVSCTVLMGFAGDNDVVRIILRESQQLKAQLFLRWKDKCKAFIIGCYSSLEERVVFQLLFEVGVSQTNSFNVSLDGQCVSWWCVHVGGT